MEEDYLPIIDLEYEELLTDSYNWLRDPDWPKGVNNPTILAHLEKENFYTAEYFQKIAPLTNQIEEEIINRVELKYESLPIKIGDYWYYSRSEEDSLYEIYCRRKDDGIEEIIFDINELSQGYNYFNVGGYALEFNKDLLAYAIDTTGREHYDIYIKNLQTGEILPDKVENSWGNIAWHPNMDGFFYIGYNDNDMCSNIYFHQLYSKQANDQLIYQENDQTYSTSMRISASGKYLFINDGNVINNEIYYINLAAPGNLKPILWKAKEGRLHYNLDHAHERFYLFNFNDPEANFRIYAIKEDGTEESFRTELEFYPIIKDLDLLDFALSDKALILKLNNNGLPLFAIYNVEKEEWKELTFDQPSYVADIYYPILYDRDNFRISFASLNTPLTIFSYNLDSDELTELKQYKPRGEFNSSDYQVERLFAPSTNDVLVPISLVYKKDLFHADGSNPLYLAGYGSYGINYEPFFRPSMLSLLDRGFVYAIAHVRGGGELGEKWYEDGKLLNKKHSFEDFIASTQYLIDQHYSSSDKIAISGASAGGMLIGAVINQAPELFKAAIAKVPFVDSLNDMLDTSLPGTIWHYNELGDPRDPEYYEYIKSYSPYENTKPQHYPALYITTALGDRRVGYWGPAKWAAKMHEASDNLVLLEINIDSGHFGGSDRFSTIHETAKEYSFVIDNISPSLI